MIKKTSERHSKIQQLFFPYSVQIYLGYLNRNFFLATGVSPRRIWTSVLADKSGTHILFLLKYEFLNGEGV